MVYFPTCYWEKTSAGADANYVCNTGATAWTMDIDPSFTATDQLSGTVHRGSHRETQVRDGKRFPVLLATSAGGRVYRTYDLFEPSDTGSFSLPVSRILELTAVNLESKNFDFTTGGEMASHRHTGVAVQLELVYVNRRLLSLFSTWDISSSAGFPDAAGVIRNNEVICLAVVRHEPTHWTDRKTVWFLGGEAEAEARYRDQRGIKISITHTGQYAFWTASSVFNLVASTIVYLGMPLLVANLILLHGCGKPSEVYQKAQREPVNLVVKFTNLICTLLLAKAAFERLAGKGDNDKPPVLTKSKFNESIKQLFHEYSGLPEESVTKMANGIFNMMDAHPGGEGEVTLQEFCGAITAGCTVDVFDMEKSFDDDRPRGALESCLIPKMANEIIRIRNRHKKEMKNVQQGRKKHKKVRHDNSIGTGASAAAASVSEA